jgi:hypothetical protein
LMRPSATDSNAAWIIKTDTKRNRQRRHLVERAFHQSRRLDWNPRVERAYYELVRARHVHPLRRLWHA